ncbi:conserved hypothetical protein, secreted [Beggiatoa sp. PS]|nr:conserved hypothetical protein, secreted [Beggiatoa sp. PS]
MILFLFTFSPAFAAPRLLATVDTNQVTPGETLTLKVELADTNAVGEPDLSSIGDDFGIYNQQQFQSTQIINGQVSRKIVWQYTLEPQKTGVLTIPSITLKTQAGNLRSQPIKIQVSNTPVKRNDGIRLEATVSNPNPYLHEPILYTLRLYHRGKLRDLEPVPPTTGVIMEQLTKLSQHRTVKNGQQVIVAQITYLLTPLRSGKLELDSAKMKALKPDNRNNSFGRNVFSFGMDYRPTTIGSAPLTLDVQPPTTQPWLPLTNLELEQKWESDITQPVIAGTPLIRTLTLVANGMGGQSPPDLEAFVPETADFRVRTPKPEIERGILKDKNTPISNITQSFSLIPLNTGTLQLPAIRIPWWHVQQKKLIWAELPAQTIQVKLNPNNFVPSNVVTTNTQTTTPIAPTPVTQPIQPISQPIYYSQTQQVLLAIAIFALIIALGQSWYSRRVEYKAAQKRSLVTSPSRMSDATFKKRLASTDKLADIKKTIQEYAHLRWQTPKNASLQTIAQYLTVHTDDDDATAKLFKELNAALYGGNQAFDLTDWKKRCGVTLTQLKNKKRSFETEQKIVFGPLNPV